MEMDSRKIDILLPSPNRVPLSNSENIMDGPQAMRIWPVIISVDEICNSSSGRVSHNKSASVKN